MRKVLIGAFGPIVRLGLYELLAEEGYELIGEDSRDMPLVERLAITPTEVVLFDIDGAPADETAKTIGDAYPSIKLIGISGSSPLMRVYGPFHGGQYHTAELNPSSLIQAVAER